MSPIEAVGFFGFICGLATLIWFLSLISATVNDCDSDEARYTSEEQNAAANFQKNAKNQPLIAIQNVIDSYRKERRAQNRSNSKREKVTIVVLAVTALFAAAAAVAAGISVWIFQGQLSATQDQLYYTVRPDVTVRSGGIVPLGDKWIPSVNVINSGGSAPVGLELWNDCVPGDKPGDPFDALHNVPSQKFTLARNDQQLIAACRPAYYSLDQMLSLGSGLYMVAKVGYTDGTRHNPRYTEMCIKISDFSKAVDDKGKPTLQDEWQYCPQGHNCTELDCKQK